MTISVAIIGMGFGGDVHIKAFDNHKDFKIYSLTDNGSGKAEKFKEKLSLNCKIITNIKEIAENKEIDMVSLAIPPSLQIPFTSIFLKKGKIVLCEKPFGNCQEDVLEFLNSFPNPKNLFFNLIFRHESMFKKIISMNKNNFVKNIRVNWQTKKLRKEGWRKRNNPIHIDRGIHIFDYIQEIQKINEWNVISKKNDYDQTDLRIIINNKINVQIFLSRKSKYYEGHLLEISSENKKIISEHKYPFSQDSKSLKFIEGQNTTNLDFEKRKIEDDRILSMISNLNYVKKKIGFKTDEAERILKTWKILSQI